MRFDDLRGRGGRGGVYDGRVMMMVCRGGWGEFGLGLGLGLGLGVFVRGFVKKFRGELGVKIEVLVEEVGEYDEVYESRVFIWSFDVFFILFWRWVVIIVLLVRVSRGRGCWECYWWGGYGVRKEKEE